MTIDSSTIYNTTYRIYTSPVIGLRLLQRELYNFDEVCREDSPAAVYRTSPPLRNEQMNKKRKNASFGRTYQSSVLSDRFVITITSPLENDRSPG
jgi:hypothetical protein